MTTSLLAHIVKGYASRQWENIATDSLYYLMRREGTGEAVGRVLAESGVSGAGLRWVTQASNDEKSGGVRLGRPGRRLSGRLLGAGWHAAVSTA